VAPLFFRDAANALNAFYSINAKYAFVSGPSFVATTAGSGHR